jgi:hypothetical protein
MTVILLPAPPYPRLTHGEHFVSVAASESAEDPVYFCLGHETG